MDETWEKPNYFLFTGGPGAGKTTVIEKLRQSGYHTVPEAARNIIRQQRKTGGNATHDGDRMTYVELMLRQSLKDYRENLLTVSAVFFDRGIPDLYSYSKRFCGGVPSAVEQAIMQFRYHPLAFVFPPWPEIYCHDEERKQSRDEAIETWHAVKEGYAACGYITVTVPKLPIEERAAFILTLTQSPKAIATATILTKLSHAINAEFGFHENTPRINYGPCGVFAILFMNAWNARFAEKAHIVFIMTPERDECWHIAVRLPSKLLYDGGVGLHTERCYPGYLIEDMVEYDHALMEKWSYGLDRTYPRYCPTFDKDKTNTLISEHLDIL
ncbi:ATPase [Legionella geestiana]|uniref:ATPase n=1 Tax=Legionella geestiana TaxID=45065 RepID=A0A0W0TJU9_9GAMM|nr:AAA family ATPase [Legionella geestiana]KTC95849.1 ATPase [Legionella geestiana]QBS13261.1 hypothetical protein E4T54_11185 [Legionella geestiana]STX54213.1 ATPase [Legionella geestiana]